MSAPDTNVEKEKRRSKPALLAIGAAVVLVLGIAFFIASGSVDDVDPETVPDPLNTVTEGDAND